MPKKSKSKLSSVDTLSFDSKQLTTAAGTSSSNEYAALTLPSGTELKAVTVDNFKDGLPKVGGTIQADQFVAARMHEVNKLQSSIKQTSNLLKLPAFEAIPRFLRRRAASHNLYHLRAKDRAKLSRKLAEGKFVRKQLRKIKSAMIMDELVSRKNKLKLLSTHKWHIKRMKMENWWEHRLAAHPMYKSRRVTYRSFTKLALLHDASYMGCLQLSGVQQSIIQLLNTMTDPLLPSVGSKRFTDGQRIGHSFWYEQGQYPRRLVCPISFLWQSVYAHAKNSVLWLWVHPSSFTLIQQQIITMANSMNGSGSKVDVQDLRDEFSRFELIGPRTTALLESVLDPVEDSIKDSLYTIPEEILRQRSDFGISSSMPRDAVLGFTVQDPRLRFPQKLSPSGWANEKMQTTTNTPVKMDGSASTSTLWYQSVREDCAAKRIPEAELIKRRQHSLLPGSKLSFTEGDSKIPIILIKRNGPLFDRSPPLRESLPRTENISAWTLIVPRAFGLAFWRSLVFAGARTGGLDDMRHIHFDCGYSCFPYDYPTTNAFSDYQATMGTARKQKWKNHPPAKRLNFDKLNIESPFNINFDILTQSVTVTKNDDGDNTQCSKQGVLLQNDKLISIVMDSGDVQKETIEDRITETMDCAVSRRDMNVNIKHKSMPLEMMIVKIRVKSLRGGTFGSGARIYLVRNDDLYEYYTSPKDSKQGHNLMLPASEDLIGFITTGNYSLMTGQGQGIGGCSALGLLRLRQIDLRQNRSVKRLVIVRNLTSQKPRSAILSIE